MDIAEAWGNPPTAHDQCLPFFASTSHIIYNYLTVDFKRTGHLPKLSLCNPTRQPFLTLYNQNIYFSRPQTTSNPHIPKRSKMKTSEGHLKHHNTQEPPKSEEATKLTRPTHPTLPLTLTACLRDPKDQAMQSPRRWLRGKVAMTGPLFKRSLCHVHPYNF